MKKKAGRLLAFVLIFAVGLICAQKNVASAEESELRMQLVVSEARNHRSVPAVVWLNPLPGTPKLPFVPTGHYTLLQKNRTFVPHLQVIPVGSVVNFPNADPFFHNVFSLYEGKRFDLGLYEAGSSRSVTFSREGVSYIFCNIHPEMSAVVLALSSPLYSIAGADGSVRLRAIPAGDYRLNIWMEGVSQTMLESLSRTVHLSAGAAVDLGSIDVPVGGTETQQHKNKFGEPYDSHTHSPY